MRKTRGRGLFVCLSVGLIFLVTIVLFVKNDSHFRWMGGVVL